MRPTAATSGGWRTATCCGVSRVLPPAGPVKGPAEVRLARRVTRGKPGPAAAPGRADGGVAAVPPTRDGERRASEGSVLASEGGGHNATLAALSPASSRPLLTRISTDMSDGARGVTLPAAEAVGAARRGDRARVPRGWRITERAVSERPTTEAKLWLLRATRRTDPEPRESPRTAHRARSA